MVRCTSCRLSNGSSLLTRRRRLLRCFAEWFCCQAMYISLYRCRCSRHRFVFSLVTLMDDQRAREKENHRQWWTIIPLERSRCYCCLDRWNTACWVDKRRKKEEISSTKERNGEHSLTMISLSALLFMLALCEDQRKYTWLFFRRWL